MFSSRIPAHRAPNRITRALAQARAGGRDLIDLTATNPTVVGLSYPTGLLQQLASDRGLVYVPNPLGLSEARRAVAEDYARRGMHVTADRVVLTASTSEAYALLFKLLCELEGSDVLVPAPSYPLFDHLTQLEGARGIPYRLEYHGCWALDESSVERAWSEGVRAVVAVSPNNPTGSILTTDELQWLTARCGARGVALVLDEVFADYPLTRHVRTKSHLQPRCLTFRLGGLSKSAGLPQLKLGWIAVDGPAETVAEALDRLELICDTYLSVSTPIQLAAPALIEAGAAIREQILERVRRNYNELCIRARQHPSTDVLRADAGWSAVVRVPSTRAEEDLVITLLEQDGVVVHPGFFFDFPTEAFVVVSLLAEPAAFDEGVRRVMERASA